MQFEPRKRKPLSVRALIKWAYPFNRERWADHFSRMADRAAYMFITGSYPSHLRPEATSILRNISLDFRRPVSLDGRLMGRRLRDEAVSELSLEQHPMVKAVRNKIEEAYRIETSRGPNTRRNFHKIFMFKLHSNQMTYHKITISIDGAVKDGWA